MRLRNSHRVDTPHPHPLLAFFGIQADRQTGVLLQKFPVTKVLGVNVFFWGVFLCCSSATHNYESMLALRILLGLMEAVIGKS